MNNNESERRTKEPESDASNRNSNENSTNSQKEVLFRKAIENAIPSGIAVIDDKGKQVYANQSFCKMVGWNEEELIGSYPPYVYWAGEDIQNINTALEKTLRNEAPKEGFDLVFCHKTGKSIPVNVIISPFIQEEKKTFWVANVIDISERKREEEEIKKSQLLLRSSMESQQGTIIFAIGSDYRYLYFNKAHRESMKYAYNQDVITGMNILDCISSDKDKKQAKENYDRALKGESHSRIQVFGDVNIAYYESFFNPIVNENGEIIGCTGLARDITKRKKADLEQKESETKLKEIINQINDGIIVFDEQRRVIIWNKGAENICGLNADEVLDHNIVDLYFKLIPPLLQDRVLIEKEIEDIITLETPEIFNQIIENEIIRLNSDTRRNIQRKVFPIKLDGYNLFCMVFRDTTEIQRYEKEILRVSADKDKFYSAIAHYLYAPFNTFNSVAKVMAVDMDSLTIKEIQKMAVTMSKSATNLYGLLDNLLQWTKMNQGKVSFNPEELNLFKTSQDALSILKANADIKNIKINHLLSDEVFVFADIYMLKTVLRNLVSNAIKFTDGNSQIDIDAYPAPAGVTISVLDNGSGLSSKNLSKLFSGSEIHTALDTAEEKGTTLGLLLCKEFIEKHGGKIWADKADNDGCVVKFILPAPAGKGI